MGGVQTKHHSGAFLPTLNQPRSSPPAAEGPTKRRAQGPNPSLAPRALEARIQPEDPQTRISSAPPSPPRPCALSRPAPSHKKAPGSCVTITL
ncbi:hypothetical protein PTTG_09533 [Puccinia triticina 1-1 BBBD Race 1]|uniref:Uncharacterized protein n=1 Tax=Puccinia triticina (isolate 1-1 / race 1 (BBBD)) TaxID=630390 RepID=A0A0C4F8N1_PUCT1|nr:hypothetical protein PTTG_09533 [Puccinia triticina 1-1 BBBD Race 1]